MALSQETGRLPVYTPGASMATIGFFLVLGHLFMRRAPRMDVLSQVVMPMVVVLLALAQLLPNALRPSPMPAGSLSPIWIRLHIGMIFLEKVEIDECCRLVEIIERESPSIFTGSRFINLADSITLVDKA